MHWAARSGQKSDRVIKAQRTFVELWAKGPSPCDDIKYTYTLGLRVLEGDPEALGQYATFGLHFESSAVRWLPWERARAVRLLNKLTAEEFRVAGTSTEHWPRGSMCRHRPKGKFRRRC